MFSREPKPLRQSPAATHSAAETRPPTVPAHATAPSAATTCTGEEVSTVIARHPHSPRPVDRRLLLGLTGLTGLAVAARLAKAGPLNPPPGPINPTGKPLSEIEPRIPLRLKDAAQNPTSSMFYLEQNGSYYLTEDLMTFDDREIIRITASCITLDLNGFAIGSPIARSPNQHNAGIKGTASTLHIHNGTIKGCSGFAIDVTATGGRISNIVASKNGAGIQVGGAIQVENCTASLNAEFGFAGYSGATFHNCVADSNGHTGFSLYEGQMHSCTARSNFAWGMDLTYAHAANCAATSNAWGGVRIGAGCMILDSLANNNYGDVVIGSAVRSGFEVVGSYNRIERCTAIDNGFGFSFLGTQARGNFVASNYAAQNNRSGSVNNYQIDNPAANPAIGPIITNLAQATNPFANIEG